MSKNTRSLLSSPVTYQSLYLMNLLLLPGLSFLYLLYLLFYREQNSRLARIHLIRAVQISIIAGVMIILIPLLIIFLSPQFEASVMIMIFYFVTLHACFVLIGMFNLSRAMAKKLPIF